MQFRRLLEAFYDEKSRVSVNNQLLILLTVFTVGKAQAIENRSRGVWRESGGVPESRETNEVSAGLVVDVGMGHPGVIIITHRKLHLNIITTSTDNTC